MKDQILNILKSVKLKLMPNNHKLDFKEVYNKNLFEGDESISGRGSSLGQTMVLKEKLIPLLEELDVKIFLDVPCGDFNWMQHINFGDIKYIGGDIVENLIEENKKRFGNMNHDFQYIDLTSSTLPDADAIFCRDVFVHLNYIQIFKALKNIKKSNIKYLMTTIFTDRQENKDLTDGVFWRPLNLQKSPFNFSQPIKLLNEKCPEGNYGEWADKCVGVWKVKDL